MPSDNIITAEGLGKKYSLRHQTGERYTTLRDVITENAIGVFRRLKRRKADKLHAPNGFSDFSISESQPLIVSDASAGREDFWALKDVSFEVKQGEVVGIIGRNGAGKSTLLKILSRITDPTEGKVRIKGRVASLLEVGTGFHPELTGRENIYLNGAILGMHRSEIKAKFDEIVAFAEVEKFLDTPVKRYSSGMYVRLAFAVAAHLDPEILIIDEVLAVGDIEFQKKCLGKMDSLARGGERTVIFVSHNMGAIIQLCERAFLLNTGKVVAAAKAEEVVKMYTKAVSDSVGSISRLQSNFRGNLAKVLRFSSLSVNTNLERNVTIISPAAAIEIEVTIESLANISSFRTTLAIFCEGVRLFSLHDSNDAVPPSAGMCFKSLFSLPAYFLRPGDYFVALGGYCPKTGDWLWATDLAHFTILEEWNEGFPAYNTGVINLDRRGRRVLLKPKYE